MGIKDLNKNLLSINTVVNKDNNKELLKQFSDIFCKKSKGVTGFICHIDMSLTLYRFLFSFDNMEDVYTAIKKCLLELKENNNKILLYLEPRYNKRKGDTHKEREISQKKTKTNIKNNIIKEIDLFNNFNSSKNISVNNSLLEAIGFYDDEEGTTIDNFQYDEYIKKIDIINKERDIYIEKTYDNLEDSIFNHGFTVSEEDYIDEKEKPEITYNTSINNKQLFQYFLQQNPMSFHQKYIKKRLLEEKIITKEELIRSEFFDGEVNIIYNIKEKYNNKKNLIISIDQDCILFGLIHHPTKYIYIKSNIGLGINDLMIIKNNYLTKNTSILTAFFNKTDYFKGVKDCGLTPIRLTNFINKSKIINQSLTLKELISSYLYWFIKNKNNIDLSKTNNFELVNTYLENFELYLSLDISFYKNNLSFKRLLIKDLHNYFLQNGQLIPLINKNGENRYVKYYELFQD